MLTTTPIAVFTYNRPLHTRRLFESLMKCRRLDECEVVVFCDGIRNSEHREQVMKTRAVVDEFVPLLGIKNVVVKQQNEGLAKSIVSGVSQLCDSYGRVIVLEDDLVVSSSFVSYMLDALARYEHDERVYQVSGYMFPIDFGDASNETKGFFLPFTATWGWATWQRAWQYFDCEAENASKILSSWQLSYRFDVGGSYPYTRMLKGRLKGKNNSWGILWYLSVFIRNGLALYPSKSLVWNGGFDGSGVHCGAVDVFKQEDMELYDGFITMPESVSVSGLALERLRSYLISRQGIISRFKTLVGLILP